MSNVNCTQLLRLAQIALKLQPETLNPYHGRHIHVSRPYRRGSSPNEHTTEPNNEGQASCSRTRSSFHQSFHRTAYERKRHDYQRDRTEQRGHARPISYMSSPSTTHYQRLNVDSNADIDTIKSAYYSLSKQYHPDIVGKDNPDAAENFRLITESYDTLSDPKARADYDKQLPSEVEARNRPAQTAWTPSGMNNRENESLFRMREANRILRAKQEEALEREKARNPGKFRAGSFKRDDDPTNSHDDLARIQNQIRSITSTRTSRGRKSDGQEFYRVHLYDTLQRRKMDLEEYQRISGSSATSDASLLVSLASVIGVFALGIMYVINLVYDIDLASLLDSRLERGFTDTEAEEVDQQ